MGIATELFRDVIAGRKTIEARLRTGKFLVMRKGDRVSLREDTWRNGRLVDSKPGRAIVQIEESLFFDTFKDMLGAIKISSVISSAKTLEEALAIYRTFYTAAQEQEYGVVALRLKLISLAPDTVSADVA